MGIYNLMEAIYLTNQIASNYKITLLKGVIETIFNETLPIQNDKPIKWLDISAGG